MATKLDTSKFTPLFRQWLRIKQQLPNVLVLFRLGDFYEMFGDDAEVGARELELTLTSRECYQGQRIPMCGVPYHALDRYLRRLIEKGYRVAVVDQTEDPKQAKGLVRREVTRVLTPGTVIEDELLPGASHNFLVSVAEHGERIGVALVDASTAEFLVTELPIQRAPATDADRLVADVPAPTAEYELLLDEIARIQPAEILLTEELYQNQQLREALAQATGAAISPAEEAAFADPGRSLREFFGVATLDGFGCADMPAAQRAAAQALEYLRAQRPAGLPRFSGITVYSRRDYLLLDASTRRNLELERTILDGRREGTLLWLLDRTRTPMGARELRSWLLQPLIDPGRIRERHDAVEQFIQHPLAADDARAALRGVYDMERLTARVSARTANPRDLKALAQSLARLPQLRAAIADCQAPLLGRLVDRIHDLSELSDLLESALSDEPPAQVSEGGIIREGYSLELDELRRAAADGRQWIAQLEDRERKRTGIKSLKVGYNQVFGYFIEVSRPNLHLVPPDYERKQTLSQAERFVTPELKEIESKVLGAEERARELEYQLFVQLRDRVAAFADQLLDTSRAIGQIDALLSLAEVAVQYNYCRPEIDDSDVIEIRDGRHPVVERLQADEPFVPNDCLLDCRGHRMLIITGPNMAGKSTYLRQVALIVVMAQMGSFVPASRARIGIVDRIFTRVGASDDLASGRSTFMIEMTEAANILHNATERSLIILDEIGRGTSTFDGLSLAWAIAEYIATRIRARTLFATHYHHLNELSEVVDGVKNYRIAVKEEGDRIVFLRRIMPGGTDRSYGIQVARLAGLPEAVVQRAQEILRQLEQEDLGRQIAPSHKAVSTIGPPVQLQLFEAAPDPIVEELEKLDIDAMAPIEALVKLKELQEQARQRKSK
ncbi:MAG: DNA mismatch repair protein MutS [Armatimonadetes bacterium]|nr:DNA mismatch repair protein MutS [Armatimonadota bacterium]